MTARSRAAETAAIVLAAGQGKRFGGAVRKQYVTLRGKPLLWWSLKAFQESSFISALILVGPADDLPGLRAQRRAGVSLNFMRWWPAAKSARDSVKAGLQALPAACRWVAVHDGVRSLIRPSEIQAVWTAARRCRAAIAAAPSRDTIKLADAGGYVRSSPDRKTVWQAQTPQIFERELLERAHRLNLDVTDDAQLVERLGVRVKLVETSMENMKVTLPRDLKMAEIILNGRGGRLAARK